MRLTQLAENIYAFPGNFSRVEPWIGVVITSVGTVLVDSGNGPKQAAVLQDELAMIGAPPVSHILLTHHHWDHVFGSCVFPQAVVVAHELTQHHLRIMVDEPWSAHYVMNKAGEDRIQLAIASLMIKAIPDWEVFQVVPAAITFTETYQLTLGETVLTMEHVGGQHEPDQCVVHVRPGNVLFVGDAVYGRGRKHEWDIEGLAQELDRFLTWEADWYVTGHHPPENHEAFKRRVASLHKRDQ